MLYRGERLIWRDGMWWFPCKAFFIPEKKEEKMSDQLLEHVKAIRLEIRRLKSRICTSHEERASVRRRVMNMEKHIRRVKYQIKKRGEQ